jgi:hypothetical protein
MSAPTKKSFTAVLEPLRNGLGWVIARIPFDVAKAWPERRQRPWRRLCAWPGKGQPSSREDDLLPIR